MDRDLNLCILCGRCVRICKAHQGEATIAFVGRGSRSRIWQAFGRSLLEAGCRFCGSCVDVCPTGSLAGRYGIGLLSVGATMQIGEDVLAKHYDIWRDAAAEHGHSAKRDTWRLGGAMHVAETREQALRDVAFCMR